MCCCCYVQKYQALRRTAENTALTLLITKTVHIFFAFLLLFIFLHFSRRRMYSVHGEEWSVAECGLIWVERSSFYVYLCIFHKCICVYVYLCTCIMYIGRSGLLQSVVLSEWRGPPSTPAPWLSSEPCELSFFLLPTWLLYDEEDDHIFIWSSSS